MDEFPLLDIAYSVGGVVTPLNVVMDIVSDGYCGTIDGLKEGVYVPVIHKYDWENVEQKGLTKGEKVRLVRPRTPHHTLHFTSHHAPHTIHHTTLPHHYTTTALYAGCDSLTCVY